MSPIGPCTRTLCPQLMVLFGKIIALLGGGTWLEERCHCGRALSSHTLIPLPDCCGGGCDGLASCSYSRVLPAMMGYIPKGKPKQTISPVRCFHPCVLLQQWEINWHCSFGMTLWCGMHACSWIWSMVSSNMDAVLINICNLRNTHTKTT